jgi:hypothetical protein
LLRIAVARIEGTKYARAFYPRHLDLCANFVSLSLSPRILCGEICSQSCARRILRDFPLLASFMLAKAKENVALLVKRVLVRPFQRSALGIVIGEQRDVTFKATDASFAAATCQSYVEVQ